MHNSSTMTFLANFGIAETTFRLHPAARGSLPCTALFSHLTNIVSINNPIARLCARGKGNTTSRPFTGPSKIRPNGLSERKKSSNTQCTTQNVDRSTSPQVLAFPVQSMIGLLAPMRISMAPCRTLQMSRRYLDGG